MNEKIKEGVKDIFNTNPELANAVYEALGLNASELSMSSFMPKKHWRIGHIIDNPTEASNICDNTQIRVLTHIENTYGKTGVRGKIFGKPVTIWAKSPINDKQILHHTVAIRLNDKVYLYDMPQSEFIKEISENKGEIVKEYTPRLIGYTHENLKKYYGTSNDNLAVQDEVILDNDILNLPTQITPQQKQQAQQLYSQYLDSLNKPNTNPILQGNQEKQVKKFAELQERLNNKEFLEGAKNAYENSEGLKSFGTQEEYNDYIARVSLGIIKNPSSGDYNYTSQVKDIVYHGTPKISKNNAYERLNLWEQYKDDLITEEEYNERIKQFPENPVIEKFDKSKIGEQSNSGLENGFYFTNNKNVALWNKSNRLLRVLLNIGYKSELDGKGEKIDFELLEFNVNNKKGISDQSSTKNIGFVYENVIDALDKDEDKLGNTYVVFEPEQIHILSSKKDIEGFKEYMKNNTDTFDNMTKLKQDLINRENLNIYCV